MLRSELFFVATVINSSYLSAKIMDLKIILISISTEFLVINYRIFGKIAFISISTDSSSDWHEVSIEINGFSGASKGAEIPVKSLISPRRALAYKPFTSRRSHSLMGVLTYISRKSFCPIISAAM